MVKITETTATKAPWATVYPNEEFLADYKDNDFASLVRKYKREGYKVRVMKHDND